MPTLERLLTANNEVRDSPCGKNSKANLKGTGRISEKPSRPECHEVKRQVFS
jgi:hypothetical protein